MCMMGGGGARPSSNNRRSGWTSGSAYGFDAQREGDLRSTTAALRGLARFPTANPSGILTGWQTREAVRGYDTWGQKLKTPMRIQGSSPSQPAAAPAAAPSPLEGFDFTLPQINIPDPPKPVGYTKGGDARKRQARARRANRSESVGGKEGLTIKKVNY